MPQTFRNAAFILDKELKIYDVDIDIDGIAPVLYLRDEDSLYYRERKNNSFVICHLEEIVTLIEG